MTHNRKSSFIRTPLQQLFTKKHPEVGSNVSGWEVGLLFLVISVTTIIFLSLLFWIVNYSDDEEITVSENVTIPTSSLINQTEKYLEYHQLSPEAYEEYTNNSI